VSSKEGTFFEESGHDSREKNSVNFWPKYFSAVGGRTVRIRTVRTVPYRYGFGTKSRHFWHGFRGNFQIFGGCFWAVRNSPYSGLWARKTRYGRGWTTVRFWHEKRGRFLWDRFGAVRYFPWLEMLFCC
jgi:hypothetical protein